MRRPKALNQCCMSSVFVQSLPSPPTPVLSPYRALLSHLEILFVDGVGHHHGDEFVGERAAVAVGRCSRCLHAQDAPPSLQHCPWVVHLFCSIPQKNDRILRTSKQ